MNQEIKEKIKKILINLDNIEKNNLKEIDYFHIDTLSYNLFMFFLFIRKRNPSI
tara:strand:- start:60513 stop:60674 length:162 start_codon:yes stop_codon:yes gene_type:complete